MEALDLLAIIGIIVLLLLLAVWRPAKVGPRPGSSPGAPRDPVAEQKQKREARREAEKQKEVARRQEAHRVEFFGLLLTFQTRKDAVNTLAVLNGFGRTLKGQPEITVYERGEVRATLKCEGHFLKNEITEVLSYAKRHGGRIHVFAAQPSTLEEFRSEFGDMYVELKPGS